MQRTHHNVELHEASYLSLTAGIYTAVDTYLLGLPAIKRDQLQMYTFGVIDYGKNCNKYKQKDCPDSKVHGANMGLIWGWQDPGGPHVGPMILAIWVCIILVRFWLEHYIKRFLLFSVKLCFICKSIVFIYVIEYITISYSWILYSLSWC